MAVKFLVQLIDFHLLLSAFVASPQGGLFSPIYVVLLFNRLTIIASWALFGFVSMCLSHTCSVFKTFTKVNKIHDLKINGVKPLLNHGLLPAIQNFGLQEIEKFILNLR
jgi:hypothetical protein